MALTTIQTGNPAVTTVASNTMRKLLFSDNHGIFPCIPGATNCSTGNLLHLHRLKFGDQQELSFLVIAKPSTADYCSENMGGSNANFSMQ